MITATIRKDKKEKRIVYSFLVNNNAFEAYYYYGRNPSMEILHNGVSLGTASGNKIKSDFTVNPDSGPLKITAWVDTGNRFFSMTTKGIGIEVNGEPVQDTLTDPGFHVKNGRSAYVLLFFILGIKTIFIYYTTYNTLTTQFVDTFTCHLSSAIAGSIYFVPLLAAVVIFINYARWTTFAIYFGIVLAIGEFIDYAVGIPQAFSGSNTASILIWILLRISALYLLFNALKWRNKQKAAQKHRKF